ncbi:MAG: ClpXP protease specificity-enhancing factor SspB [Polyangiaceae bacterium]
MPDPPKPLPPKREVCLALLKDPSVFIHLDPRRQGVVVPPWFKRQPQLVLQIGLNMPTPIDDLEVDDEAISCTLSFSRSPFTCYLPWDAVYALVGEGGRFMVWPADVPPEVAAQMQQKMQQSTPFTPDKDAKAAAKPAARDAKDSKGKAKKAKRPQLASVPSPAPSGRTPQPEAAPAPVAIPMPAPSGKNVIQPAPAVSAPTETPAQVSEPAATPAVSPVAAPVPAPALAPAETAAKADERGSDDELPIPARPKTSGKPKRELPPYLRVIK